MWCAGAGAPALASQGFRVYGTQTQNPSIRRGACCAQELAHRHWHGLPPTPLAALAGTAQEGMVAEHPCDWRAPPPSDWAPCVDIGTNSAHGASRGEPQKLWKGLLILFGRYIAACCVRCMSVLRW